MEKLRKKIQEDLMAQLKERGMTQMYYVSLVEDYLSFWDIKNELIADIEERGVSTVYDNGGGQRGYKKNDSVPELNRTNAQMLKILSELGLRGADIEVVREVEGL